MFPSTLSIIDNVIVSCTVVEQGVKV